jgi:hypothetical protein
VTQKKRFRNTDPQLLDKNATPAVVDAEGKNGVTPLHVAAHYDHQNVALLLLDKVKNFLKLFVTNTI